MANWMSAQAIAERYIVGEARLFDYARRGNLPWLRPEGGAVLFDESFCARFFRPRAAGAAISYREPRGPHLAVLGVTRIGAKAAPPRSMRRRSGAVSIEPTELLEPARRRSAG